MRLYQGDPSVQGRKRSKEGDEEDGDGEESPIPPPESRVLRTQIIFIFFPPAVENPDYQNNGVSIKHGEYHIIDLNGSSAARPETYRTIFTPSLYIQLHFPQIISPFFGEHFLFNNRRIAVISSNAVI